MVGLDFIALIQPGYFFVAFVILVRATQLPVRKYRARESLCVNLNPDSPCLGQHRFQAVLSNPWPCQKTRLETKVTPDPGLEKRSRRGYSTVCMLKIIAEADACVHGEIGAFLRRENLDRNELSQWRRDFAAHGVAGLGKSAPGPKASRSSDQRRIEQLEKANA